MITFPIIAYSCQNDAYAVSRADICDVNSLQFDLNEIWAAEWQLFIPISKSFILHVGFINPNS